MVAAPAAVQVMVAMEDPVAGEGAEVLHLRVAEQVYRHHMIQHMGQNLRQHFLADMVNPVDHGIPQYQELIQQEHRGRVAAALVKLEVVDLILQVATANHIE